MISQEWATREYMPLANREQGLYIIASSYWVLMKTHTHIHTTPKDYIMLVTELKG